MGNRFVAKVTGESVGFPMLQITLFDLKQLSKTSLMALFGGKLRTQKCPDNFGRQFQAYYSRTEADQVHIIMLNPLMGGIGVMAQSGPYSGYLVCSNRGADAGTADENAPLGLIAYQSPANFGCVIRIINWISRIGAQIDNFVAISFEDRQ